MPENKLKSKDSTAHGTQKLSAMGLPFAVGTMAVQAWADMGAEAVRFVWDRMQQDIKIQQSMLACASLEELRQVQSEFFTAAREQYAAEAGKMLALMRKGVSGLTVLPTARRYDDIPL